MRPYHLLFFLLPALMRMGIPWSPVFPAQPNVHSWRIFYNDSLVYSSRYDDQKKYGFSQGRGPFSLSLSASRVKQQDSLRIEYFQCVICGQIPLVVTKNERGQVTGRFEQTNIISLGQLLQKHPAPSTVHVYYTGVCPPSDTGRISWPEDRMMEMVNIQVLP